MTVQHKGTKKAAASRKSPTPIQSRHPGNFSITLAEWQRSQTRVAWMQRIQRDRTFRDLLSVLHNHLPIAVPTPNSDSNFELGRIHGYREALEVFSRAAVPDEPMQNIGEPDYLNDQDPDV